MRILKFLRKLKGHQIIGELRLTWCLLTQHQFVLKGHQIIGELRRYAPDLLRPGVELKGHQIIGELRHFIYLLFLFFSCIEGSPDHWWVTSIELAEVKPRNWLKGHQIIGELRPPTNSARAVSCNWRVTRSLVSYVSRYAFSRAAATNWRVTRSLVSYVNSRSCNNRY